MKLSELLAGRPDFGSKPSIIRFAQNSKFFNRSKESVETADALLIFSTSNQRTWLVSTNERLYCILDDIRKDEPHINWSVAKSKLVQGGRVIASIEVGERSPLSGTVNIAHSKRPWLYTKRLFENKSIQDSIRELLERTMQ